MRQGRRLLCTAAVSALVALTGGGVSAAHAQVAMAEHSEGVFAIGIPSGDEQPAEDPVRADSRAPAPAQVQAIWDLGAEGQWDSAHRLLKALEDANTDWQAPANLTAYLATGRRDQRIRDALETRDWPAALALLPASVVEAEIAAGLLLTAPLVGGPPPRRLIAQRLREAELSPIAARFLQKAQTLQEL